MADATCEIEPTDNSPASAASSLSHFPCPTSFTPEPMRESRISSESRRYGKPMRQHRLSMTPDKPLALQMLERESFNEKLFSRFILDSLATVETRDMHGIHRRIIRTHTTQHALVHTRTHQPSILMAECGIMSEAKRLDAMQQLNDDASTQRPFRTTRLMHTRSSKRNRCAARNHICPSGAHRHLVHTTVGRSSLALPRVSVTHTCARYRCVDRCELRYCCVSCQTFRCSFACVCFGCHFAYTFCYYVHEHGELTLTHTCTR